MSVEIRSVEIRRLQLDDLAVVLADRGEIFDHAPTPERTAAFFADPAHRLLGALHEGRLVGFLSALLVRHPDKAPQFWINELGVAEDWRRRGVARALLDAAEALAAAEGAKPVFVLTEADNAPANALYAGRAGVVREDVAMYTLGDAAAAD